MNNAFTMPPAQTLVSCDLDFLIQKLESFMPWTRVYFRPLKKFVALPLAIVKKGVELPLEHIKKG